MVDLARALQEPRVRIPLRARSCRGASGNGQGGQSPAPSSGSLRRRAAWLPTILATAPWHKEAEGVSINHGRRCLRSKKRGHRAADFGPSSWQRQWRRGSPLTPSNSARRRRHQIGPGGIPLKPHGGDNKTRRQGALAVVAGPPLRASNVGMPGTMPQRAHECDEDGQGENEVGVLF